MKKIRILSIVAIGLFLSNILLIGFLLSKSNHLNHEGPRDIIIEKLNFDQEQTAKYDELIQWHRMQIRKSDLEIKDLKNQLYGTLMKDSVSTLKDSLINELGAVHSRIESIHYKHFTDIKQICHKDQLKAFEKLTREIAFLFAPPHEKRREK